MFRVSRTVGVRVGRSIGGLDPVDRRRPARRRRAIAPSRTSARSRCPIHGSMSRSHPQRSGRRSLPCSASASFRALQMRVELGDRDAGLHPYERRSGNRLPTIALPRTFVPPAIVPPAIAPPCFYRRHAQQLLLQVQRPAQTSWDGRGCRRSAPRPTRSDRSPRRAPCNPRARLRAPLHTAPRASSESPRAVDRCAGCRCRCARLCAM